MAHIVLNNYVHKSGDSENRLNRSDYGCVYCNAHYNIAFGNVRWQRDITFYRPVTVPIFYGVNAMHRQETV